MLGIKRIPEEQRWIVERFGRYARTVGPGLCWVWPFIEKVRTFVSIWEQRYPLFEKGIKIDFINGSAEPKGAFVFVQCNEKDAEAHRKMVYAIKNVKEATVTLVENTVRSYWNTLEVNDALKGGHNILTGMPPKDKNAMVRRLRDWGLKLCRITVDDFDLDKTIIEARENVLRQAREADAAIFVAQTRARETIRTKLEMLSEATGRDIKDIQEEIQGSEELQKEFGELSTDLIRRRMAIDGGSFADIRVEGAEGGFKDLITLFSVWKRMPSGKKRQEVGEEKK